MPFRSSMIVALALLAAGGLSADGPRRRVAPPNPAFLEWQARNKEIQSAAQTRGVALGAEDGAGRFGFVPPPFRYPEVVAPVTEVEAMVRAGLKAYPASYDMRTLDLLPPIRNQNPFGTCWTFSVYASMESNIKKTTGDFVDFSEWHLAWFAYNPVNEMPSFTLGPGSVFDQGGDTYMALAMITRGTGPVLEEVAPYQSSLPDGAEPNAAIVKNVYSFLTCDRDTIKGLVQTNGALAIAMLWPERSEDAYYNYSTAAFRHVQSGYVNLNHAVAIVGWDDRFPKDKFPVSNQPTADGAWIVRNSWGTSFGDGGYFYVSYDTSLEYFDSFVSVPQSDSKIYQHDYLGLVTLFGYDPPAASDTAWFSNVFQATGDDLLTDVSFYTEAANASYEISVRSGVTGNPGTGTLVHGPQKGTLDMPGYHRIPLSEPVAVGGKKFAVIVRLRTPGYDYPVPICCPYYGYSDAAKGTPGNGFASPNGVAWQDVKAIQEYDLDNVSICLKAFAVPANPPPLSVAVSPASATLAFGEVQQFPAPVTGGMGNRNVTWSATGSGTITQGGFFTAPRAQGTYTVTATSVEDGTKKGTATVTVLPAVIDVVDPPVVVFVNATASFQAKVGGLENKAVRWTASAGSIDQAGKFRAPAEPGVVTVTATSAADDDLKASINVPIRTGPDGGTSADPQLLGFGNAFGRPAQGATDQYDLNGDGVVDVRDLNILFRGMGWM